MTHDFVIDHRQQRLRRDPCLTGSEHVDEPKLAGRALTVAIGECVAVHHVDGVDVTRALGADQHAQILWSLLVNRNQT
jgi:hypothetical protein